MTYVAAFLMNSLGCHKYLRSRLTSAAFDSEISMYFHLLMSFTKSIMIRCAHRSRDREGMSVQTACWQQVLIIRLANACMMT